MVTKTTDECVIVRSSAVADALCAAVSAAAAGAGTARLPWGRAGARLQPWARIHLISDQGVGGLRALLHQHAQQAVRRRAHAHHPDFPLRHRHLVDAEEGGELRL